MQPEAHVQGVNATAGGLVKATLGSGIVAGAILFFAWLPAEHGFDPTGVGHLLGLTEMGHIKEQLHAEADADAAATLATDSGVEPSPGNLEITQKLDAIQTQLDAIAASIKANPATPEPAAAWRDEVEYTLEPSEGIEVKLVMDKGTVAEFEWTANGGVVNHNTHGDAKDQSISYEKGRAVPEQAGQLTAAFNGFHGWYWRNRTDTPVVVTLRTRGDYKGMLLP